MKKGKELSVALRIAFSSWVPPRFEWVPIFGGHTVILRLWWVWLIVNVTLT